MSRGEPLTYFDGSYELRDKAYHFFKTHDRFPKWVFVGLSIYGALLANREAAGRHINYVTVDTLIGVRDGVAGSAFGIAAILPLASLDDTAIGEMEALPE